MIILEARVLEEAGYEQALRGLSYNKKQFHKTQEELHKLAVKLVDRDGGHNKFLESIQVWLNIKAPRFFWQEFDTYRVGITKQSESTMHNKTTLCSSDFEGEHDRDYLDKMNNYILSGDFLKFKQNLKESYIQSRIVCCNYKALRTIILQRYTHRLPHWRKFCFQMLCQLERPELITKNHVEIENHCLELKNGE